MKARAWFMAASVASLVTLGAACAPTPPPTTMSYTTPGEFSYTVPQGVQSLKIVAVGAGGAGASANHLIDPANLFGGWTIVPGANGGSGATVTSTVDVVPGQVLRLIVGGGGTPTPYEPGPDPQHPGQIGGGAGGGSTNVYLDSAVWLPIGRFIIAGAGGGASINDPGGSAALNGTSAGGPGVDGSPAATGGANGIGGSPGGCVQGNLAGAGGNGPGGRGGDNSGGVGGFGSGTGTGGNAYGDFQGGGGGGYGGGGGGACGSGAAGGSTGPTATTFASANNGGAGLQSGGDGSITITPLA